MFNARNLKQQEGDMEGKPGSNSNLTEEGDKMARAFGEFNRLLGKTSLLCPR